jgi:hypothetical protein
MLRIILPSVTCPAIQYFSTLSHKRHDCREKVNVHKMYVLIFSTNLSETFLILRRTEGNTAKNIRRTSCEVPMNLFRY